MTEATHALPDGSGVSTTTLDYSYGDVAHPAAVTSTGGGVTSPYSYDGAGRMMSRPHPSGVGSQSLSWDVLSNLIDAGDESYFYDAGGQRVARIVDDTATVWVGADEAKDSDTTTSSGVSASRYYTFGGSSVAVRHVGDVDHDGNDDSGLQFLLADLQGSASVAVDVTLDGSGQVQLADAATSWSSTDYTPYGTTRASDNLTISRGWLGQVEDTTTPGGTTGTGLTYLNARYYDPTIGRFLSPDPLMNPGDPRTLDAYQYAGNNPVTYSDPTGLRLACASGGARDQDSCFYGVEGVELRASPLGGGANSEWDRGGNAPKRTSHWLTAESHGDPLFIPKLAANFAGGALNGVIDTLNLSFYVMPPMLSYAYGPGSGMPQIPTVGIWGEDESLSAFYFWASYGGSATGVVGGAGAAGAGAKGLKGIGKIGKSSAANTGALTTRAQQIQGVLDPIAQNSRTYAVLCTREGTSVISSGGRDLSPLQRAMAGDGDMLATMPGAHAEVTAVSGALNAGLTPTGLGVSRTICPACQVYLEGTGATVSGNSAWWVPRGAS